MMGYGAGGEGLAPLSPDEAQWMHNDDPSG